VEPTLRRRLFVVIYIGVLNRALYHTVLRRGPLRAGWTRARLSRTLFRRNYTQSPLESTSTVFSFIIRQQRRSHRPLRTYHDPTHFTLSQSLVFVAQSRRVNISWRLFITARYPRSVIHCFMSIVHLTPGHVTVGRSYLSRCFVPALRQYSHSSDITVHYQFVRSYRLWT